MKCLTRLIAVLFLFSSFGFGIYAEDIDLQKEINDFIKEFYNTEEDYYTDTITVDTNEDGVNEVLSLNLEDRIEEYKRYGYLLNPLTYGSNGERKLTGLWSPGYTDGVTHKVDLIGYNRFGVEVRPYVDINNNKYDGFYKWESGWADKQLSENYVKYTDETFGNWVFDHGDEFWDQYEIDTYYATEYSYDKLVLTENHDQKLDLMERAIQTGVDEVYGGVVGSQLDNIDYHANWVLHDKEDKPDTCDWSECLLIVTPPTDISWGMGWRFNRFHYVDAYNDYIHYLIVEIPIAPFNMVENLDLSAHFSEQIATANEGDEVTFVAEVYSNEQAEKEEVSYEWRITDFSGNLIDATYSGEGDSQTGTFSINSDVPKIFKATFTMPAHGVNVSFTVNGDEKYTEENYDNNTVQMSVGLLFPEPPQRLGEVILDYDIYARNQDSNLAYMTANLPSGLDYVGTGSARINSYTENASILYDYQYQTGASVNSAPFTIDPWYKGLILRSGFGDMPEWSTYLANGIYQEDVAEVSDGYAKRRYRYTITGEDGEPITRYSTVTAYFPDTTSHLPVTTRVYNGVPYLSAPVTQNNVTGANLKWTSVPITFNVNRKMYRMDLYGNRVDERIVPGQYVRTFTDQNSASVVWSVVTSQAQGYEQDRRTAKNRGTSYHNAIFATDKQFSNVDYPIKSGYMFNPVGVYRCVVNSTVYYDSAASEAEKKQTHEELVNKVINSFVYDNKMTYTYNGKDTYDFTNVTSASPKDILHIRRDDNVNIALIPHTQYQTCMEGYEESGTIDSFNSYKYREYVAADRVSRIDAQTVITFTVSSSSKRYTHINMKDGNYSISAFSNPFPFKGLTAPGVHLSDSITVSVKGSVYDDRG